MGAFSNTDKWNREDLARRITRFRLEFIDLPTVSKQMGEFIRLRDKGICIYCKTAPGIDCDHVIPRTNGGLNIRENIVLSCHRCNCIKSSSFNTEFLNIAFNYLLDIGENIDWINSIFPQEDELEEIKELTILKEKSECLHCRKIIINDKFCSDACEERFNWGRDVNRQECWNCTGMVQDNEEDFCSEDCEELFYEDIDYIVI